MWLSKRSSVDGDPGTYVVPMGRVIGTSGETNIKNLINIFDYDAHDLTNDPLAQNEFFERWIKSLS